MPSTMSRPSCPADVADDQGSHVHVPEPYEDDAEITADELARFIVEHTDARGQIQSQQERIEELKRELAAARVDNGYRCYDCEALRTDLRQTQQALDEAADLLARERIQRVQSGLELERLQVHCDRLSKLLDNATLQLAAAQSAATASHVSRSAPPAVLSGEYREPSPLSPHRPPFTLSSPHSAIPVSARAASSYASPRISVRGGCATITSAAELNALIGQAAVTSVTMSEDRSLIRRESLPGIERNSRIISWGVPGGVRSDGLLLQSPVLTVSKLHSVAMQPLELVVWRLGGQFFETELKKWRALRDQLAQLGLWALLSAAATGILRIVEGDGEIEATKRAALADMCARAQQPFSGFSPNSPLLLVLAESRPGTPFVYVTYDVFTEMETLLYELLRKAASVELQRELFQQGSALSSYSVLACLSHLSFTAQFQYSGYRKEVHEATISLKYAAKLYPTFAEWLRQLCLRFAFFNTAFSNSECCSGADFVDTVHSLLGTSLLTRATIDQSFPRGADKRLQLSNLHDEFEYFAKLAEFLPGMNVSATGNVATVGAVHPNVPKLSQEEFNAHCKWWRTQPGAGANTQGHRAHAAESLDPSVCFRCNQSQEACIVCEYCLTCGHTAEQCPFVEATDAAAVPVKPKYVCPRCNTKGSDAAAHWAFQCKFLAKDLLSHKFRGKSSREVYAIGKQGAANRAAPGTKKTALASFGKLVDGQLKKSFRKMSAAAMKDPAVRSRMVTQLIASLAEPTSGSTTQSAAAAPTAAAPARVNAVDLEFIRSLDRQYAEAEQRESLQHRAHG